jgi:hypothetical protein
MLCIGGVELAYLRHLWYPSNVHCAAAALAVSANATHTYSFISLATLTLAILLHVLRYCLQCAARLVAVHV